jgi:hypothetical protein
MRQLACTRAGSVRALTGGEHVRDERAEDVVHGDEPEVVAAVVAQQGRADHRPLRPVAVSRACHTSFSFVRCIQLTSFTCDNEREFSFSPLKLDTP